MIKSITGADVRKLRLRLKLNQSDFWNRVGMIQVRGSYYELGKNKIPLPLQSLLLLAYGSDRDALRFIRALRRGIHSRDGGSHRINHLTLREIRSKFKLSQSAFWERVGVTQTGGCHYEAGDSPVSKTVRYLLTLVYGSDEESEKLFNQLREKSTA
ncbi:MAG: hypothetical protein LBG61_02790, partial [Burkholderiales bacterium]|nr:hypothetical protein [Burkholderiales bacterium]